MALYFKDVVIGIFCRSRVIESSACLLSGNTIDYCQPNWEFAGKAVCGCVVGSDWYGFI
jgi:hypothetical protein